MIFPCICCSRLSKYYPLCFYCRLPTSLTDQYRCTRCFTPSDQIICENCLDAPLPWDHLRYVYRYDAVHYLIHRMKFNALQNLTRFVGDILSRHIFLFPNNRCWDCIVPAPITEQALYERKFNQSYLLSQSLSKSLKLPIHSYFKKHGPVQSTLTEKRRRAVHANIHLRTSEKIAGKRILFVDDIITTGGTAAACTNLLRLHGASSVDIFTVASATRREIFPFYLRSSMK